MPTKIERRRTVVTLYQGDLEHQLTDLMEQALAAQRHEELTANQRAGTRSKAMQLAKKHDELVASAEDTAVKVTVWAISYNEWGPLADRHPPREDEGEDKNRGVNFKTFPRDLLYVSLVDPSQDLDLDEKLAAGKVALRELGDLSQVHYIKLENAAWNVNVGDDALPKYSLASLLKRQRDLDSTPLNDLE